MVESSSVDKLRVRLSQFNYSVVPAAADPAQVKKFVRRINQLYTQLVAEFCTGYQHLDPAVIQAELMSQLVEHQPDLIQEFKLLVDQQFS
jgi:hypothetical protein